MTSPLYSASGFDFFKLHELDKRFVDEAADLLSDEWTARSKEGESPLTNLYRSSCYIYFMREIMNNGETLARSNTNSRTKQ